MEEKKSKKKMVIIVLVILLVIIIAAAGGYFAYEYIEKNKSVGTEWGDTYYAYMQSEIEKEDSTIKKDADEYEMQFLSVEEDEKPVMTIKSKKKENDTENIMLGIYYIDDNNAVNGFTQTSTNDIDVELLYNRKDEQYKWYTKEVDDKENTIYQDIQKNVENHKQETNEDASITFTKEEMPVETIEETTAISKFEETFIVPTNVQESNTIKITNINDIQTIKEELTEAVDGYKTNEQVVTEEVKQAVEDETTNIENREQAIKKAAEEAAKKEAEEQANKTIEAGKYTLKYGTYKGTDYLYTDNASTKTEITIILKTDGTYTLTKKVSSTGKTDTTSGKFSIVDLENKYGSSYFSGRKGIEFEDDYTLMVSGNNTLEVLAGSGDRFTYKGN